MKEGWTYKKLGDVFVSINNGANIKQIKGASGIPITRIETLSNDMFNRDRMGYANIDIVSPYTSYVLNDGDILMSHINSMKFLGRAVAYVKKDEETIIHGMNLLRLVPTSDVLSPFMVYQFQTKYFRNQILQISHQSVNQASFNTTNLKGLNVMVPSLSEQQSIVDYLDSAFAKIDAMKANAEKALNEAKALFQASLKEMLEPKEGWEEKALKDVCKVINGRAYSKDEMLKQGKYRLLRVGNFFTNDNWYYSDLELEEDKYCDNGDLLYAWSASFGPRIWDGEKVIYHYHIWKMVCSAEIDKYFLCYWLDSDELKKQAMTNLHGATMAHITKGIIEAAQVSFPSLSKQQSIVESLDTLKSKVDKLQENFDKISQECDALKQTILRQVFE